MKKISKIIAIFLSIVMLFGVCSCGGGGGGGDGEINYEIDLSVKPTLKVLMPNSGKSINEVNTSSNALLIEQLTGYKVEYTQLPADAATTLNTELMDKRPYNAIKLTKNQFSDLVKDDMLVDITDALEVFAPDILANISDESWDVVTVDGRIYGIPERASSDNIENPIVFNQDLLFECSLDMPTTLDEFTNVLRVLTQKIGKPALTFDMFTPLVYSISSAFGIYAEWQEYDINGTTEIRYYMNAPGYEDYVNYMHDLYTNGYIDQSVGTNTSSDALSKFTSGNAAAYACSLWSVPQIVGGLQANQKITASEAAGTLENYLGYLRSLKADANSPEKVYRSSGYGYITAIPFYMAEDAGYALDWMNSKIKDTEENPNFRSIVLGEENVHWTYSPTEGYLPLGDKFMEKDDASYYLTGSNETKYTQYWLARARKQPELYRAWSILMENADVVGVYNIVDFTPPIEAYNSNRSAIEEYAQERFFVMVKDGIGNINEYYNKLNNQNKCNEATSAINQWYKNYD